MTAETADVESGIFEILQKEGSVEPDRLSRSATLEELELESLDVVEILFAIEERFDIEIPLNAQEILERFKTVGDIVDSVTIYLQQRQG